MGMGIVWNGDMGDGDVGTGGDTGWGQEGCVGVGAQMGTRGGVAWPRMTPSREGPMSWTCTWARLWGGAATKPPVLGEVGQPRGSTKPEWGSLWGSTTWGAEPSLGAPDLQHSIAPG